MLTTFSRDDLDGYLVEVASITEDFSIRYPYQGGLRQPVHSVYGGANLFRSDTVAKLGSLALNSFRKYACDAESFGRLLEIPAALREIVFTRVEEKLASGAIEDYRIDFEDGYGIRSDSEEDSDAERAASATAAALLNGGLPAFFGIRIKPLSGEQGRRALRTLDIYVSSLCRETDSRLPSNFVTTIPKVTSPRQVSLISDALAKLESSLGLAENSIRIEVMIETPQSIIGPDGKAALPAIIHAGKGRVRGAHFGTYDYTAACGITSAFQDMLHPACDLARNMMQVSLSGTGIWLADGATNIMPLGPHRGNELTAEQITENSTVVHRAWKLHYGHCRHSLASGFYQGWDLHPAQLPTRYAAIYSFFFEGLEASTDRLKNFIDAAARSTLIGDIFDDAATGQGLLNYFLRAVNCGAMAEEEAAQLTGLSLDEFRSASFEKILSNRLE